MNDGLKVIISLSCSGSVLILFFFLCRRFLKDRISRQWQYYVWLIVIARLLLPLSAEVNLVGHFFRAAERTELQNADGLSMQQTDTGRMREQTPGQTSGTADLQEIRKRDNLSSESQPIQFMSAMLFNHLWLIWFLTALILLLRKIFYYQRFVRQVKEGQTETSASRLSECLDTLAKQSGIRRKTGLSVNPAVSSPMILGLIHPYIVLPDADIPERDFRYTALHELTHYRRRDMLYKWLVQATVCVHWFNPLVYLMSREINKDCEFSCDEAVIGKLDSGSAREYGLTLLNAMPVTGKRRESMLSVTLTENKNILKERLGAIMNYKKKSGPAVCLTVLLTALLLSGFAFTGSYTSETKKMQEDVSSGQTGTRESKSAGNASETETGPDTQRQKENTEQTVSYENVEMRRYEGGWPYIHDIRMNNTDKKIVSTQRGMTAFDKEGNPLLIDWNGLDSSSEPSFYFLYDWDESELLPGLTDNRDGGWTLNIYGEDSNADKIEYVLYCDRQITFSDGTVWENPEFESWRLKYEGKKAEVSDLKDYYPYVQTIEFK